jgi:hypothetical protein
MEARNLQRYFDLPGEDEEYLQARALPWETVSENNVQWLMVQNFPIPNGYNNRIATVAIQIPLNYPTAGLDMVYFNPQLLRVDGVQIRNTESTIIIQGLTFQRWSRHRTTENPWRPEIDNIAVHLGLVEEWLQREFR